MRAAASRSAGEKLREKRAAQTVLTGEDVSEPGGEPNAMALPATRPRPTVERDIAPDKMAVSDRSSMAAVDIRSSLTGWLSTRFAPRTSRSVKAT